MLLSCFALDKFHQLLAGGIELSSDEDDDLKSDPLSSLSLDDL